jgi:predicted ATPase
VFAGTFSLRAVEEVCGFSPLNEEQILDLMDGLSRQSLVNREGTLQGETRFRLLESMRQFAIGELRAWGEMSRLRDRHQAHFSTIAFEAEAHMLGPEQRQWSEGLEQD